MSAVMAWLEQAWVQGVPTLLDAYCCEGGASRGYSDGGFAVFGVDLFEGYTQKRYPFPSHKGDAVEFIVEYGFLFDAIHASPPCQDRSAGTRSIRKNNGAAYPRLIVPTRLALERTGKPWILENVEGADLIDPIELCGCMFDLTAPDADGLPLRMERTRLFESNISLTQPCDHHHDPDVWVAGCYGGSRRAKRRPGESLAEVAPRDRHEAKYVRHGGYVPRSKAVVERLMGIDWMTWKGLHQALPPDYTEWLAADLMRAIQRGEVAA